MLKAGPAAAKIVHDPAMTDYIDTWYRRSLVGETVYPPRAGRHEFETCVIGGGLAGLSAAHDLAACGRSVILLEARRIAWGASGRNGGFLTPGYATGLDAIERRVGREAADTLYRLSMEGVDIVRDRLAQWQVPGSHLSAGVIYATRYDSGETLRREAEVENARFGRRLQFLDRDALGARLNSTRYFQALLDPEASHFHPLNYAQALAARITGQGGTIAEESPALKVEKHAGGHLVTTPQARIAARHVVFAGGGYSDGVAPALARAFLPIATYVMLTEKLGARVHEIIRTRAAIADDRRAGDYYRLVDGDRLLWGGRITTARNADATAITASLRRQMVGTYPALADAKIELAWSGLMSYARHLMPQIGRLEEGLWYCTGFGGHGLNTTAVGGRLVAEAITGSSDRYRHFAPFGLAWAGGPIGLMAAQATYWYLQAMDWWRERR
ncbi:gamma-glutamylputrescine oxidase [Dongia mobilis]|uniref:Gamma-glutamylputrescine oxidase n=2 Tax=Dongia mobilis TaxID=578943 RepID=A0A4R6WXC0_9PROT|nr:gamma-glutamylputrescine oxidase [Dongia mobilis]